MWLRHLKMKTKKTVIPDYRQFLKQTHASDGNLDIALVEGLLNRIEPLLSQPMPFAPAVFGIDYQAHNYLFWKNNHNGFGGYTSDFFLKEGHDGVVNMINPLHFNVVSEKIFPITLNAIQKASSENTIISSFNYKGRNTEGKDFNVFQKCIYLMSEKTGLPLYCIGIGMDITNFKKDNFICHTIESLNTETNKIEIISEFTYNPNPEVSFTPKETLIIHYLLDGFSSKQIAEKLFVSINTINNHRQNILKKASCNNLAQLMAFVLSGKLK